MEFDASNKDTLIKAIQSDVEAFGAKYFRKNYALFFSDAELHKKSAQQLREMHLQLQKDALGFLNKCTDGHKEDLTNWLNQPENDADYQYWCRVPFWSIWESAVLLLGKDPEKISEFKLEEYQRRFPSVPFTVKFKRLLSLLTRYRWGGELKNEIYPSALLTWAEELKIDDIPIGLKESLNSLGKYVDWKTQYEQLNIQYAESLRLISEKDQLLAKFKELHSDMNKPLGEKERQSICKIIAAMAYDAYRYDPAKNSDVTKQISDAVTEWLGETVDLGTIRKWLKKEACERYPNKKQK